MLKLLRWSSRTAVGIALALLARHALTSDDIDARWIVPLGIVLVIAIVVAVVTFEPVLKLLSRGPKLVSGDFVEYTRDAIGGSDLQVFGVEIYNERESGGEAKTARDVVPSIEAYTLDGQHVTGNLGVWFPDGSGNIPTTVTFRPTHEKHAVELCGKFPGGSDAWLAGEQDPPSLMPGIYEVRVTLRGDNLRRPARLKFFVRNPGQGGRLTAAKKRAELERVTPVAMPEEIHPDALPSEVTPDREPEPEPEVESEPELPTDPIERIDVLLAQAEDLDQQLWERQRALRRSGSPFPTLGSEFLGRVRTWNGYVLALADEYLPIRESANVDALAGWSSMMASATQIDALLNNNKNVLARIRRLLEQGRVVEKEGGGG
jgi:hypothetical protein